MSNQESCYETQQPRFIDGMDFRVYSIFCGARNGMAAAHVKNCGATREVDADEVIE